jgi:pimeloyl-ACP methyl ester carboxylesterase
MFIQLGNRMMNTVSFGAGDPPLFAVGGWIGTWQVWRQPFEILSRSRRCIAYDHRGSGQSLADPAELHMQGMVDDVFAVMDALEVDRCWLAGESQGGFIAASAALTDPSRFLGLAIVSSTPFLDQTAQAASAKFAERLEADADATLRRFVNACIPEPESEHLRRWLRHILDEAEPQSGPALIRQIGVDLRGRLSQLRLPTLVIHGKEDVIISPDGANAFAAGISGAQLLLLEGVGHVPTLTRPVEVARALDHFMGGQP